MKEVELVIPRWLKNNTAIYIGLLFTFHVRFPECTRALLLELDLSALAAAKPWSVKHLRVQSAATWGRKGACLT